MSKKIANQFKKEKEAEIFSAMAAEGHIPEGNMVSKIARHLRGDPVLAPIIKNKQGPKGRTSLMFAAKEGELERVRFLLKHHADPTKEDVDFHSVIYYAALGGNRGVLDLLIEHGADINYQNKWGNTALHYAGAYGNVAAVEILCAAGANVNKVNQNENTPLMETLEPIMVRVRNKPSDETKAEIVRILQAGSDLRMRNRQGLTALSLASYSGNVQAVRLLCAGSDVNNRDNDGSTALLHAVAGIESFDTPGENVEEIIEILLSNGANPNIPDDRGRTLDMFIDSFIQDKELKGRLQQKIAEAGASAAGASAAGSTRKRKGRKGRNGNTRKAKVRKTRKALS
jgi:ankyrin repeat protein